MTHSTTAAGDRRQPRPPTSTYLVGKHVRAVIFDLDGTLAPSKSRIAGSTRDLLGALLERVDVCIISGGPFEQFDTQVVRHLDSSRNLTHLHLMPTCGTQDLRWVSGSGQLVYAEDLKPDAGGPRHPDHLLGAGTAGSARGKDRLGPGRVQEGRTVSLRRDPPAGVRGTPCGSTSVDVTAKGVDKAYGVGKLQQYLHLGLEELLFLGDRLDPDGNDHPVLTMGVTCIPGAGWEATSKRIADLLALL